MGFYSGRDYSSLMLEAEGLEDGVVVDMDDGYSQDLKTVEDNVEPYNAEDVAAAQTGHPNDDEGFDPVEESWNVVYESQYNMNQIMKAIALSECNAAYSGVLTESWDDVKGFFTRVKEAFVRLVKKVAAIVKKWIDNVTTTFRSNKSFMSKYGNKLSEGMAAAKKSDKKMKGYPFSASLIEGGMKKKVDDDCKTEISSTFGVDFKSGSINDSVANSYTGAQYTERMGAIYKKIADGFATGSKVAKTCKTMEDLRKAVKAAYYGAEEKSEMWMEVDSIKAILGKSDNCISNAKKAYKEFEKSMNQTISALKKLENSTSKEYNKSEDRSTDTNKTRSGRLNAIRQGVNACQDAANAMQVCNSVWLSAMRTYAFQARAYANTYVYALNKKGTGEKIDKIYGREPKEEGALLAGVEFI